MDNGTSNQWYQLSVNNTFSEFNTTENGLDTIEVSLDREIKKQKLTAQEQLKTISRISGTTNIDDFRDFLLFNNFKILFTIH